MTILLCLLTGIALELGIHALSRRREAWDSPLYWTIGLPVVAVGAAAVGFLWRDRDWLWTLVIVPNQVMTMMLRNGEISGLWPLTVILSSVLIPVSRDSLVLSGSVGRGGNTSQSRD